MGQGTMEVGFEAPRAEGALSSEAEGWRLLAEALEARRIAPPLFPERPWAGLLAALEGEAWSPALRLAAVVIGDRPLEALTLPPSCSGTAPVWRAIALRRAARFPEARRAFRELGARPEYPQLFQAAQVVLGAAGPGYRWAGTAAAHLAVHGCWDPVWFVDACASVYSGLLSRETAALLEEIQRAELRLLIEAGAAG
jgi:hypothetical protein